ncbi:MAG: hypothetical protein RH981_06500 [Arenibacter sp.]
MAIICQLIAHPWSSISLFNNIGALEKPRDTVMLLTKLILPLFFLNHIMIMFLEVIFNTP